MNNEICICSFKAASCSESYALENPGANVNLYSFSKQIEKKSFKNAIIKAVYAFRGIVLQAGSICGGGWKRNPLGNVRYFLLLMGETRGEKCNIE